MVLHNVLRVYICCVLESEKLVIINSTITKYAITCYIFCIVDSYEKIIIHKESIILWDQSIYETTSTELNQVHNLKYNTQSFFFILRYVSAKQINLFSCRVYIFSHHFTFICIFLMQIHTKFQH